MASIRDLKKDINFVLGDIIEAVYIWEADSGNTNSADGNAIIEEAITVFDGLMDKVNQKVEGSKKAHFKTVRKELEEKATVLIEKLNKLAA
ncbi:Hypothetical protein I595_2274 [Croceitalea dokdonensis DOKDO 023]|uniref:Uncharacterized protein n=1 Tax=Croceitalea dokdonensis DOKDO 023 TaxID=1300341 RepID=A0A0P7ATL0_9FLAO|nr:hypothetical protein [Croceitalea dokdonensis]KPM31779.1 Hypothetical protein I595_2274 [Croceitalea dokdonensis DOKDO 023]